MKDRLCRFVGARPIAMGGTGFLRSTIVGTALLLGLAATAEASPIVTLSFGGVVANGYDSSDLFGGGSLTGDSFTASLTFDPLAIGSDSCGTSTHTTSCNWSASGGSSFAETLTIVAKGQDYTQAFLGATSSSLSLSSGGNDAIYLYFGGSGLSISLNAVDLAKTGLFADNADVNDLDLNFSTLALNTSSSAEYGNEDSTSFTLAFASLAATTNSGADPVPEPATFALFGTALVGFALFLRRSRKVSFQGSRA